MKKVTPKKGILKKYFRVRDSRRREIQKNSPSTTRISEALTTLVPASEGNRRICNALTAYAFGHDRCCFLLSETRENLIYLTVSDFVKPFCRASSAEAILAVAPLIIDKTQAVGAAMCMVGFLRYGEELKGDLSSDQQKMMTSLDLCRGVAKNGYLLDLESTIGDEFENGDMVPLEYPPLAKSCDVRTLPTAVEPERITQTTGRIKKKQVKSFLKKKICSCRI